MIDIRIEWISNGLTPEARAELGSDLERLFPEKKAQCLCFVEKIDEHIDEFHKLLLPAWAEAQSRPARLERLENAGRAFAAAIQNLDSDTIDLLEQRRLVVGGDVGQVEYQALLDIIAAKAALLADDSGDIRAGLDKKRRGRRVGGPLPALIEEIAKTYVVAFDIQPSAAREGLFARVLDLVLTAADVADRVGETKLAGILKRCRQRGLLQTASPTGTR